MISLISGCMIPPSSYSQTPSCRLLLMIQCIPFTAPSSTWGTGYLYIDLRNAIRWENGPHIITHWKLWLPRFIATGCKTYATECVHLLTHLCADLPKHLAYIAMHNRTVNVEGKPGRGKPIDQMTEHYILYVN